jgi:hypothetical protein
VRAELGARDGPAGDGGLLLVFIERVEEGAVELREGQGFGVVARPIWVPVVVSEMGKEGDERETYFSSSSSRERGPLPYCCSSSSFASSVGDLGRLSWLILAFGFDDDVYDLVLCSVGAIVEISWSMTGMT